MARLIILRGCTGAGKSSVAKSMAGIIPSLAVVEVDDIKMRRHGTTTICNPDVDFPEAGKIARAYLDNGLDVVIVEPFVSPEWYQQMLDGAGMTEDSPGTLSVWLACTETNAIIRKAGELSPDIVKQQFQSYPSRYKPENELVILTDDVPVSKVTEEILLRSGCAYSTLRNDKCNTNIR